jgi:hypothetical protein
MYSSVFLKVILFLWFQVRVPISCFRFFVIFISGMPISHSSWSTTLSRSGAQLFPFDLSHPIGHGKLLSYCHDKYGSVSFASTSAIRAVCPGNLDDSSNTSSEEIDICPHPFSNNVSMLVAYMYSLNPDQRIAEAHLMKSVFVFQKIWREDRHHWASFSSRIYAQGPESFQ